jgi:hypothetical protein
MDNSIFCWLEKVGAPVVGPPSPELAGKPPFEKIGSLNPNGPNNTRGAAWDNFRMKK